MKNILILLCLLASMACSAQPSDHMRDVNTLEKEIERKDFGATSFGDTVTFVFKGKEYRRSKKVHIRSDWGEVKERFKGTDYTINPFIGKMPSKIMLGDNIRYIELASHKYKYIVGLKDQDIVLVYEVELNVPTDAPPH
jgi:hypothetical protein